MLALHKTGRIGSERKGSLSKNSSSKKFSPDVSCTNSAQSITLSKPKKSMFSKNVASSKEISSKTLAIPQDPQLLMMSTTQFLKQRMERDLDSKQKMRRSGSVEVVAENAMHPFRMFSAQNQRQKYEYKNNIDPKYFSHMKAKINHMRLKVTYFYLSLS